MNIKKAIISGVILYALIFLIASGLMVVVTDENVFGTITMITAAILTFLISKYYYFKGMKVSDTIKEGLILGIILVVITFVIEVPVMVYGFAADRGWSYLMTWHIILGYFLTLIIPVLVTYKMK